MQRCVKTNWSTLRHDIEAALQPLDAFRKSVRIAGKLQRMNFGLNHENYLFCLVGEEESPHSTKCGYVLRKRRRDCDDASYKRGIVRLRNEASVLKALASIDLDFAAPEFMCFVGAPGSACDGFIETAIPGIRVDKVAKTTDMRSFAIDAIARIAAAVHRLPATCFGFLDSHADVAAHVEDRCSKLPSTVLADDPDASRALRWIEAHSNERRPAVVLHGDLLPQNILWDWEDNRLGVVDWEYAEIGDPAYDLAIVTRGNAKLFGLPGGVRRLVDAYHRAGGRPITPADVMTHELLLVLNWLGEAIRREREGIHEGDPPEHHRNQIRSILRRAESH